MRSDLPLRLAVLCALGLLAGCTPPTADLTGNEGASPEPAPPPVKVDLPPLIKLEGSLPPETHPDQKLRVDGLLTRAGKYMGQKILVRGYVVEKSNCPKEAKRCERPHLWLADTPAGGDKRLMLVGLYDELLEKLEIGAQHVVTGQFARQSDDGFVMSSGLLVYESIEGIEDPRKIEAEKAAAKAKPSR
ncbi:MAG: hypothetical protein KC613_19895 [Myxococcales bacterium]|nr:hypothetical protein [Myxococcales bacterium]